MSRSYSTNNRQLMKVLLYSGWLQFEQGHSGKGTDCMKRQVFHIMRGTQTRQKLHKQDKNILSINIIFNII